MLMQETLIDRTVSRIVPEIHFAGSIRTLEARNHSCGMWLSMALSFKCNSLSAALMPLQESLMIIVICIEPCLQSLAPSCGLRFDAFAVVHCFNITCSNP